MKHAKKMIMVSEPEYAALLSLLKTANPMQNELAQVDAKMRQSVRTPKGASNSEETRGREYDWLYKKRRQLRKNLDEKPQRVLIVNEAGGPTAPPHLGLNASQTKPDLKAQQVQQSSEGALTESDAPTPRVERRKTRRRTAKRLVPPNADSPGEWGSEDTDAFESAIEGERVQRKAAEKARGEFKYSPERPRINPGFYDSLLKYVNSNRNKLDIDEDGKIRGANGIPISGSDHVGVLKYLTGKAEDAPPGTYFLLRKLGKDPKYLEFWEKSAQSGSGRRVLVKAGAFPKKTEGLKRTKPPPNFKPRIWAKL